MSEFFKGKRCLVTGGAGFVGTHLCRRLAELGAKTYSLDVRDSGQKGDAPRWFDTDVTELRDVTCAFGAAVPQVVFHLAARTEVGRSLTDPSGTLWMNWGGTLNVLEVCRRRHVAGMGLQALVVASSDKAYGVQSAPFRESDPLLASLDPYGNSKRAADDLAHGYADQFGLPLRVLRCCNVFGPGQRNETTLVTAATLAVLRGQRPKAHEGACGREWMYVGDCVDAYLLAAEDAASGNPAGPPGPGSYAYNVGTGNRIDPAGVIRKILKVLGKDEFAYDVVSRDGLPRRDYDQCLSSDRFRDHFPSWQPRTFASALGDSVTWYKEHLGTFDEKTKGAAS